MNPTSHRMSFSFCYCHFISTWKLKTLGRKANHLWCLKCGSVSLRVWLWHSGHCVLSPPAVSVPCALGADLDGCRALTAEGVGSHSPCSTLGSGRLVFRFIWKQHYPDCYSLLCSSFTGPQENRSRGLFLTLILYWVEWIGIASLTGPWHYPGQNCEKYPNKHLEFWSL